MVIRIAVNVNMTMLPFYLDKVTKFSPTATNPTPSELALVPLLSYIMSMIFSIKFQSSMNSCLKSRYLPMFLGMVIVCQTSVPMGYLDKATRNWVYPLATFQGLGLAILLNTATSLISDMIGCDQQNCAFVYGTYSFLDRISNGILIYWLVANFSEDSLRL